MRSLSLVAICGLLLAATACGDDSSGSGGEINSREDVQSFFAAIVPDLVEAFTELANDQSLATSPLSMASMTKSSHLSSVPCPDGGTLVVDLTTGQATLTNCSLGGVTISATLALFVFSLGPSAYGANFNGILMVTGSFTGTVEVNSALIEWTDPATVANTFWDITVTVNGQTFTVSSGDSGLECNEPDPVDGPGSVPRNGPCDEDSDCQSNSCRDPITNPSEGCTCRGSDGGEDCSQCVGVSAGPDGVATSCPGQAVDFACTCTTDTGAVLQFFISGGAGCVF